MGTVVMIIRSRRAARGGRGGRMDSDMAKKNPQAAKNYSNLTDNGALTIQCVTYKQNLHTNQSEAHRREHRVVPWGGRPTHSCHRPKPSPSSLQCLGLSPPDPYVSHEAPALLRQYALA